MARGKKATEEEFYRVQQLSCLDLSIKHIADITHRSQSFIKEMLNYEEFDDYYHRNDQLKANKLAEQQNLEFLDLNRPVGAYVDEFFKHEVITMLRDAFKFRPVAETEVMQFIEDHEHDTDLMQRINWQSFTKLPKYKEKHDV